MECEKRTEEDTREQERMRWNGVTVFGTCCYFQPVPTAVFLIVVVQDGEYGYQNLFDATVDALHHSHKVPGSTGSRNGVEGRGSSLYKIVVRKGYTSVER